MRDLSRDTKLGERMEENAARPGNRHSSDAYIQAVKADWVRYVERCLEPSTGFFAADLETEAALKFQPPYSGRDFVGHVYDGFTGRIDKAIQLHQSYISDREWGVSTSGEIVMWYPGYNMAREVLGKLRHLKSDLAPRGSVISHADVGHIYFLNAAVLRQLEGVKALREQLMEAYQKIANREQGGETDV